MVFSSTLFLFVFLPLVLIAYYAPWFGKRNYKNGILLLASLFFYAWGEPAFFFLMAASICVNWGIGLVLDRTSKMSVRKIWLFAAVVFDLGMLFVFKYATFVAKNLNLLLGENTLNINIALPIGISFFTFQILSYVIDVYRKKVAVQKSVFKLGLYISMFPQLIAGPIVRYETIAEEINTRKENLTDFTEGFRRFVYGLGKKSLIANYMAVVADNIFFYSDSMAVLTAWIGIIAYTLQIYFDFSGYSDMAIGLGRMFGFHFDENFNYPYIAKSVTEFWRRWHISLSTWFRDYVYIPLGGNRCSRGRWVRNMFVVWLLTGIWHGANWTFIVWGLFYLVFLLFEKFTGFAEKLKWFGHVYTLLVVMAAWVFFRAASIGDALDYLGVMFGINADGLTDGLGNAMLGSVKILLPAAVLLSTPVYSRLLGLLKKPVVRTCVENVIVLAVFVLSLLACIKSTHNPFIYFNF